MLINSNNIIIKLNQTINRTNYLIDNFSDLISKETFDNVIEEQKAAKLARKMILNETYKVYSTTCFPSTKYKFKY